MELLQLNSSEFTELTIETDGTALILQSGDVYISEASNGDNAIFLNKNVILNAGTYYLKSIDSQGLVGVSNKVGFNKGGTSAGGGNTSLEFSTPLVNADGNIQLKLNRTLQVDSAGALGVGSTIIDGSQPNTFTQYVQFNKNIALYDNACIELGTNSNYKKMYIGAEPDDRGDYTAGNLIKIYNGFLKLTSPQNIILAPTTEINFDNKPLNNVNAVNVNGSARIGDTLNIVNNLNVGRNTTIDGETIHNHNVFLLNDKPLKIGWNTSDIKLVVSCFSGRKDMYIEATQGYLHIKARSHILLDAGTEIQCNNKRIRQVLAPENNTDVANKEYVDNKVGSVSGVTTESVEQIVTNKVNSKFPIIEATANPSDVLTDDGQYCFQIVG